MTNEFNTYIPDEKYAEKYFQINKLPIKKTIQGFKYIVNGAKCEIDLKLKQRLDKDAVAVANCWDLVYAVSGMEGSGKSKGIACTMASYFSYKFRKPFSLKNIVFTDKQFGELVDIATPGTVIWWDEFILGGSAEDTLKLMQRVLKKKFTIIRSKRLIIILVIPYFHMMSKYWAVSRTRALIDCVSYDGIRRGTAKLYGYAKKRFAYIVGKRLQTLEGFKHDFQIEYLDLGSKEVTSEDIIDWDKYEDKKQKSILEIEKREEKRSIMVERYFTRCGLLMTHLMEEHSYKHKDIGVIVNLKAKTISDFLISYRDKRNPLSLED